MSQFTLQEIWVYPIKSLAGFLVTSAVVQPKGLALDRRWMLIDDASVAMTQRVYPEMALFKVQVHEHHISIGYTVGERIISSIEFAVSDRKADSVITAKIWDDTVTVQEVDPVLSKWFANRLKANCKLVAFPEENPRPVDNRYSVNDEHVGLADAYPFLLIGRSTLDDLNTRLAQPVPMNRFRPNFVFTGGTPFLEDSWRNLHIGKVPFVAVKKSERCVVITVNQDTAEKGSEPLRTLSTYRKVDNKVYFGQNLIATAGGTVSVGDALIPQ